MFPNGQQQSNLNKNVGFFSSGYVYPYAMSGQSIVMAPNGAPCLVQPVYNMKPTMQCNTLPTRSAQAHPEKKQLQNFANFSSSSTKNADDMIRSIIFDSKSLMNDLPKKSVNKSIIEMTDTFNNNVVVTSPGYNPCGLRSPQNNYSVLHQGLALAQNSNFVPSTNEPHIDGDDDDDFGDFIGVQLEVAKSPTEVLPAPHIHPPPMRASLPNSFPSVQSFSPVTATTSGESIDEFAAYGIQMPRWIANERHVPKVYKKVLDSVTRNGAIDTQLLHSELLKSGLSREVLGYLWDLCNRRVRGSMDRCELFLMLAMISICQNKLDCSSLCILTKCPQAPIPKLDVNDDRVLLENNDASLRNNLDSDPSSTFHLPASPSSAVPIESHHQEFIGGGSNKVLAREAPMLSADAFHVETLWGCAGNAEVKRNKEHDHRSDCGGGANSNEVHENENDDEFDDFKSAPDASGSLPSKMMRSSSSSSYIVLPSPPLQTTKKPPTLLSLASPVLSNPPSSLYPSSSLSLSFSPNQENQLMMSTSKELSSSLVVGTSPPLHNHQTSPSLQHYNTTLPASGSEKVIEDKYAAFREFQLAEEIPDRRHEDDEFGDFESSSRVPSSAASFFERDVVGRAGLASTPVAYPTAARPTFVGGRLGATAVELDEDANEEEFTEFASAPPMHLLRPHSSSREIEGKDNVLTIKPSRQNKYSETNDVQHIPEKKCDWSDFLDLDGISDSKSSEKMSKESNVDYDDDFEDFVSHESKWRNAKNVDFSKHGAKTFMTDIFATSERKLENPADRKMDLNLDLFCGGTSLNKKALSKVEERSMDWNLSIAQRDDAESRRAVGNVSNVDDNVSFRSLEFKISKLPSSAQTPDDSQSTSSATDLEKKSTGDRSLSSPDLFRSNESNIATASSSNSLANNTADPSPNFLFGSGKPLDAKEILDKMGGVIAADRYYGLTDHTQDSDSHAYHWTRCLKVVDAMVKQANKIFCDVPDKDSILELFKIEKGLLYFKGLAEMFLVAARISFQMKASSICSEELIKLQKSIDAEWKKLSGTVPDDISSMFLPSLTLTRLDLDDPSLRLLLVEPNDLDAYRWSCGLCLLRVADAIPSSQVPTEGVLLTFGDRLEYGGRSYHPQCANLWINCVDLTLPSLNIPELL